MKASSLILLGLTLGSLLALYSVSVTLTTTDAEGRLLFAVVAGGLVAVLLPLWGLFLKKSAFWLFVPIVAAGLYAVMALNAWACRISGTYWIHFYDHWFVLLLSSPSMAALIVRMRLGQPTPAEAVFQQEDVWPPPPKPPTA